MTTLAVAIAVAGWFVLTARQIAVTVEPTPDEIELTGSPLHFRIGESYLLRHGTYEIRAELEGYYDLREPFTVDAGSDDRLTFVMQELPGLVTLDCVGGDAPDETLPGVEVLVDETPLGPTPLGEVELERGTHVVQLAADRYQPLETEIEVEGFGRAQSFTMELRPDWASVEITTLPVSAELWIDGVAVTTTPCRIDVDSGVRSVELRAEKFETWQRQIEVVAEQPISLMDVTLTPAKGIVVVETQPPGAQVLLDGQYVGMSPLETEATPDADLLVRVARDGYESAEQTTRVGPEETATVSFELTPQFGTVYLEVVPEDASLLVDGVEQGVVPRQVTLTAEEHQLEFSKDGYVTATRVVRPRPGVTERVTLELEPVVKMAQPGAAAGPGTPVKAASNGYAFVLIEPGAYTMGSSRREQGRRSNETLRKIELRRPFYMGAREVTNAEFLEFDPDHRSGMVEQTPLSGKTRPVVQVTWDEAARFCNWLSARDQLPDAYVEENGAMRPVEPVTIGYRMPTEAEWEYAARSGTGTLLKYPWGSSFPPRKKSGNYADDSAAPLLNVRIEDYEDGYAASAPAGSYDANSHGVHDLGGNVSEWCHDFYSMYSYDAKRIDVDPVGPKTGRHHVVRGSSWRHSSISTLRLSYRDYCAEQRDDLGFRICRYLSAEEAANEAKGN